MDAAERYVGRKVDGRYEVMGALGEGGMGVVLRARHAFTGAEVALKLLHPHIGGRADIARRFLAEARAPAAIQHPGLVPVTDAGVTPEGEIYLVMELLRGEALSARMQRDALDFEEIRRIGREVLGVLAAAHGAGFVHRDLKPDNVFLSGASAVVRVLDFGIAKITGEQAGPGGATATGALMGTLAYMSPEQLRDTSRVDQRADLWALGVMLYEMVGGALPHSAPSFGEMLIRLMTVPAPPIADQVANAPAALDAFFRRALAMRIEERFGAAGEMDAALAALPYVGLARRHGPAAMAPTAASSPSRASTSQGAFAAPSVPATSAGAPFVVPATAPQQAFAAPGAMGPPRQAPGAWTAAGAAPDARERPWWVLASVGVGALVVLAGAGVLAAVSLRDRGGSGSASGDDRGTPATGSDDVCARACTKLQGCGVAIDDACATNCAGSAELRKCLSDAASAGKMGDCDDVSACVLGAICGGTPPHGRASCRETASCEAACSTRNPADVGCVCGCIGRMDAARSQELLANNACAAQRCPRVCNSQTPFSLCLDCFARSCGTESRACQAN